MRHFSAEKPRAFHVGCFPRLGILVLSSMRSSLLLVFLSFAIAAELITLPSIPTIDFNATSASTFALSSLTSIVIDQRFQNNTDSTGQTLVPPSLSAFAHTFAADYSSIFHVDLPIITDLAPRNLSIFLTLASNKIGEFFDAAGRPTSEGYTLTVSSEGIEISGASPLGVWWGTRTLLQQAKLGAMSLPIGSGKDAPGWGTRGIMLDAGRHFYPPSFFISLCSYISFFKQNTLHLHLSDNLYNNVNIYTRQRSLDLYAAFRLRSGDPTVAGLVKPFRANETYTREEFEDIQRQCAARGVTVIPELEAPGHALAISQWKPEIGLRDLSLLNITHPETIPTMKSIWSTFLPWFHSKVVHIGADEYDSALADDYNFFVNTMSSFITNTSGKETRIWGTNEPGRTSTVDRSITIQHWEFFEDNPFQLLNQSYRVLNSDDGFYIVNKFSGSYPQTLNITRIFHGNPGGGPFAPFVFDTKNPRNNPPRNHPGVLGHIAAQWNDYGQNASTYSEAWYSWRSGLAALSDKQWGGKLTMEHWSANFPVLHAMAPAQNLDKVIPTKTDAILRYDFSAATIDNVVKDISGNGYDGICTPSCRTAEDGSISFKHQEFLSTPLSTKGRNYTLSFAVKLSPSSPLGSTIFTGADSVLQHGNGTVPNLMLITSVNQPYALNFTLPTDVWTNVKLVGRDTRTFLSVNGGREMEFLTIIGVNGNQFVWKEIAIEAPIARIGGGTFVGKIANVTLLRTA
jgi:hexosaminidase